MTGTHCTVLFMSGGSLVGQNVLHTLERRREGLRLVVSNSVAEEASLFDFDAAYLVPRTLDADFPAAFKTLLERERPALVIPCRDDDVSFLARFAAEQAPARRRRYLCGSPQAADAMLDKWQSFRFSMDHVLPFAATAPAGQDRSGLSEFLQRHGFPLLAKPARGFASRDVRLLFDESGLAELPDGMLVQEYLGDPERASSLRESIAGGSLPLFHSLEEDKVSVQLLVGPEGNLLAGPLVTRNVMRFGRSVAVERRDDAAAEELGHRCYRAFADAGWRGPLNIQCQRRLNGSLAIYEYNGRFTGATAARYLLGYDEVGLALAAFAGVDAGEGLPAAREGRVVRETRSRVVDRESVDVLNAAGFWQR